MANTMRWKDYRFDYSAIRVLCVECCRCEYAMQTKLNRNNINITRSPRDRHSLHSRKIKINEWWSKRVYHIPCTQKHTRSQSHQKRGFHCPVIRLYPFFTCSHTRIDSAHKSISTNRFGIIKPLFVYTASRLAQRRSNQMIISLMWHTFGWRRCAIRHSQRVFLLLFNSSFFLSLSFAILPILRYIELASIANRPRFVYLFINSP